MLTFSANIAMFLLDSETRRPTEETFPPQNFPQRNKLAAQEQQMHYKHAKKVEEKKVLIHLSPF